MRLRFYFNQLASNGFGHANIDNLKITEELPKWNLTGTGVRASDGLPHTINKNGRIRVQTEVNWAGVQSELISVEAGKPHQLKLEFEMVSPMATGPFVKIEERDAGGSWSDVRIYYFAATSGVQQISIDFTPTKEEIRLYLSTSDPSNSFSPPTKLYYNNFSITDGTTAAVTDGGVGNKVAFKYRIHDASIGRFLSRDPLAARFAFNSPYSFSLNRVIDRIELEGAETALPPYVDINRGNVTAMDNARVETIYVQNHIQSFEHHGVPQVADPNAVANMEAEALFFSMMPVTGEISDAIEFKNDAEQGNYGMAAISAVATSIPFVSAKLVKKVLGFGGDAVKRVNFDDLAKTGKIDPREVNFSQNSIKSTFSDGGSVSDLTKGLKDGTIDPNSIPAIRITEKDGKIFSLDNRRLKAFQDAGVDINFEKVDFKTLPKKELKKFSTTNGGTDIKIREK